MATTPFSESSANSPNSAIASAATTAAAGSAIKSAANASVDWVKASVTDYKFTGYGVVSRGSSVKMFMGTDQQFFLGGKNAMTIGTSNTFTGGIKTDVMVGAAVSMNIGFQDWKTAGTLQLGHFTAKYDFSTNKTFAFQIAPEGSSNYVFQSKFNCEKGFQAVGGYQPGGQKIYEAYKLTISRMGTLVAVTNFLMSIQQIAQTLESAEPAKGETLTGARKLWAEVLPGVVAGTSAGVITTAAIYAALRRETFFKSAIHPQSVIDLTKTSVFLGALGNGMSATEQDGASLLLKGGKATLGARTIGPSTFAKPYKDKTFDDFATVPTSALVIDSKTITSYADKISIAAGGLQGSDPMAAAVEEAQKALDKVNATAAALAQTQYDAIKLVPIPPSPLAEALETIREQRAIDARDASMLASAPLILAAQTAFDAAVTYYKTNPSLFLSAGSKLKSLLSKIEATAPNFNVIAPNISLATNSPKTPATRGLFVTTLPAPSIDLIHSPTSKISFNKFGEIALSVSPTISINLKLGSVNVAVGPSSINMGPTATTINSGGTKIQLAFGQVMVGSSLKVIG